MAKYSLLFLLVCQFWIYSNGNLFKPLELLPEQISFSALHSNKVYSDRDDVVEDIYLRFYNGKTVSDYVEVKILKSIDILKEKEFDINNVTVFYAHGWGENADKDSVQTVVSAYLKHRPEINVILIDWSNMAGGNYVSSAALNTRPVSEEVAKQIKNMVDAGLPIPNIHVVGHSLGGQVAGFIGENTQKYHGFILNRISALDPAFPMFYPGHMLGQISKRSAKFVDVIHTAASQFGAPVPTGTIDFWPNGGFPTQPGCKKIVIPLSPDDMCSHWRSWMFWAESIGTPQAFAAKKGGDFNDDNHDSPDVVYMGQNTNLSAYGNYYLKTNSASPFGKYEDGLK